MPTSRRNLIKTMASAAVVTPVAAQHNHNGAGGFIQIARPSAPYKPKFFSAKDFETVRVLVDLILPRTDTPGASDAGVHRIIDTNLSRQPAPAQKIWRDGLAWAHSQAEQAGGKSFTALPEARQVEILQAASQEQDTARARFFTALKGATVDAYYSTREGLQTELGWNANTFLPEFKGCTHKEHQG